MSSPKTVSKTRQLTPRKSRLLNVFLLIFINGNTDFKFAQCFFAGIWNASPLVLPLTPYYVPIGLVEIRQSDKLKMQEIHWTYKVQAESGAEAYLKIHTDCFRTEGQKSYHTAAFIHLWINFPKEKTKGSVGIRTADHQQWLISEEGHSVLTVKGT